MNGLLPNRASVSADQSIPGYTKTHNYGNGKLCKLPKLDAKLSIHHNDIQTNSLTCDQTPSQTELCFLPSGRHFLQDAILDEQPANRRYHYGGKALRTAVCDTRAALVP